MKRQFPNAVTALLLLALSLALGGCFSSSGVVDDPAADTAVPPARGTAPDSTASEPDPLRSRIVFTALQMVGTPYRYGGATPQGFDCSGLVQYAYRNAGLAVPRTSRAQLAATTPVPLAEAAPGDLLFFQGKDSSHVGIYLGEGRFVHAPFTGRNVEIGNLDDGYYRENFVRAGRVPGVATQAATCKAGSGNPC
ncbi:MAG: hypothetical protein AMXMBFR45_09020 [Gammaproteobacteria bacterium]|nr:NlpC/P60 family protein [Gammaproteobacteria bacterium]MCE7897203.1 NlpC/P60 family protein [Gammaproteobacteria bacterium PRO8]MCL4776672.1 C40 family peptidase [Gammaproteobacteria bacterium]MDL1881520.1 NlpC/P60 family protein [Gammaproteobacteria bacterium PRO2]GIK34831.1 MAG: lipoprotein [Gammaproteobacteria bacterium]